MIGACNNETAIQIASNLAVDDLITDIVEKTNGSLIITDVVTD